jgi:hypothetical protein
MAAPLAAVVAVVDVVVVMKWLRINIDWRIRAGRTQLVRGRRDSLSRLVFVLRRFAALSDRFKHGCLL